MVLNNLFDTSRREPDSTISGGERGGNIIFPGGATLDTDSTQLALTFAQFTETDRVLGYKATYSILNASGATDTFRYQIQNVTKATALGTFAASLSDGSTITNTKFYSNEQISPGDQIRLLVYEGIVGTVNSGDSTSYWSCPGTSFKCTTPSTDSYAYENHSLRTNIGDLDAFAPVFLPHGAVVTAAVVTGDRSTKTWTLSQGVRTSTVDNTMATTTVNTEDTSISNATIDNEAYVYKIFVDALEGNERLRGARITYTTPRVLGIVSFKTETLQRRDSIDGIN